MSHSPFRKPFSRRNLLRSLSFTPLVFLPAPLRLFGSDRAGTTEFPFTDYRVVPHYPTKSPLDDVISLAMPGTDQFLSEKYAFEIEEKLRSWADELQRGTANVESLKRFCDKQVRGSDFGSPTENVNRQQYGIHCGTRKYKPTELDRDAFLPSFQNYFDSLGALITAEFQIISVRQQTSSPLSVAAEIRYALVGKNHDGGRQQRVGLWKTEWARRHGAWRAVRWIAGDETVSHAPGSLFIDVSMQAFANIDSYQQQLLRGADHWRTVLDGASGIDVYGNQGIAVGDFDGDGYDDFYICQPSGLPNLLYRNRGDGTFEDVTTRAGLDVLDATSCALFADFEDRGHQDLLVVTNGGPLLFVNDGNGKFVLQQNAFTFARPPQGTFTHAAVADFDHDGRLDVYFCLYNYYAGLDQYRYPSPYFDARNGPPNFLFHNDGNWKFSDRTDAAGLNADNNRYSFACAWGDANGDGWPDLYVANDFGRSNLYRNNGDGTFTSIAGEANVDDVGAGMSASWLDSDGDGQQDIYVANMWSAAGLRVSAQNNFHSEDPDGVRALYRRHARGNSLYKNLGGGKFRNVADPAGAEYGGWAWASDSWDFDHDGRPDIYIANGYVSGDDQADLASFFWRQVVGNSPARLSPSTKYEHGWNAINEMIRSDRSWSGYERNVFYCNNGDGTFSDISGVTAIDFPDDSRAFVLADFDHDGRPEVVLKNRNAPQLRLLRNAMSEIGNAVAFRLRGTKSNRDAVGAAVTVEADGRKQTKYLQAGSGFLSQHAKELFFGVGEATGFLKAIIRWPNGVSQVVEHIPVNHRVMIEEGSNELRATAFTSSPLARNPASHSASTREPEHLIETWLLQPLPAPRFSLADTAGKSWGLHSVQGTKLLVFFATHSDASRTQITALNQYGKTSSLPAILAICVDDSPDPVAIRSIVSGDALTLPLLLSTPEVTGIYNIVFRYLFDRHRDLGVPTSFLIDANGAIVKVYQGVVAPENVVADSRRIPSNSIERQRQGLPFPGRLHLSSFQRNDFTYGVAFFQRGYLEAATEAFKQVITSKPDDAEAHYNLGTLYLQKKDLPAARAELTKTVELKPSHTQAWNNLGMIAAQEGRTDEAIEDFQRCLDISPDYATGLLNLGNLYRREKQFSEAEQLLNRARDIESNAEVNYSLAMLYAQQNQIQNAEQSFDTALKLRPDYPDALNNYGVLLVRAQRYAEAEEKFRSCIQSNPNFDQAYVNLARLYALLNEKDKARQVLQSLLRVQPEHTTAQEMLKVLQ